MNNAIALVVGWLLDRLFGDPPSLPHPIVGFGKMIAFGERHLNKGRFRRLKGGCLALFLIAITYVSIYWLFQIPFLKDSFWGILLAAILVFYCLAGTTLLREVRAVFKAVNQSVENGRRQLSRIVGRDTHELTPQEIRTAALETLAENLSDGVIAPLFWYGLLGVPGMMAYKMINTLDSMIAYKTPRYRQFGTFAAYIDDAANYIPARITALLMLFADKVVRGAPSNLPPLGEASDLLEKDSFEGEVASPSGGRLKGASCLRFVWRQAANHTSPNSGWPEAALAAILNCRFGGTHQYFGESVEKPYIGTNNRLLSEQDLNYATKICRMAEIFALVIVSVLLLTRTLLTL